MSDRMSKVSLGVFALAVLALLCCDLGPAWTPDGKAVVFQFTTGKARGLARHDLAEGTTSIIVPARDFVLLQPAFAPDGKTLYAIGAGGEQGKEVTALRIDPNGSIKALATLGEKEDDSNFPFGPLFVRDDRLWCWRDRPLPGAAATSDDDNKKERMITAAWIDLATGATTWPFGDERWVLPFKGAAGIFYVEPIAKEGVAAKDDDDFDDGFAFGRIDMDEAGRAVTVELGRRDEGLGGGFMAVGERHLAFLCKKEKVTEDEPKSRAATILMVAIEGLAARPIDVELSEDVLALVFGPDDARLWLAAEDGLIRLDRESGAAAKFDAAALAGIRADSINALGLSLSPQEPLLALQLFPKDLKDKEAADAPDLLLIDEDADPPTAKAVKVPR